MLCVIAHLRTLSEHCLEGPSDQPIVMTGLVCDLLLIVDMKKIPGRNYGVDLLNRHRVLLPHADQQTCQLLNPVIPRDVVRSDRL